jgi:hypothetical protein
MPQYRVLEVNRVRAHRYETLYFDTRGLALYARHHSGKFTRHKIRYRRYADSGVCFFEIKAKNNKARTLKQRVQRAAIANVIEGEAADLLRKETPYSPAEFGPKLWVDFTRFTFVSRRSPERLTIDVDISYRVEGHHGQETMLCAHEPGLVEGRAPARPASSPSIPQASQELRPPSANGRFTGSGRQDFPKLVIAEVKRGRSSSGSLFVDIMRDRRIWEGSMSKYCFGVVNLYPFVKMNLFKERVRQIKELVL